MRSGRSGGTHPMGEKQNQPFQLLFNTSLKVDFQGLWSTSDGGLILVRELAERLGLEKLIEEHLSDSRQGSSKQFTLADLLRQSVYSRLAGYEDLNDALRDPRVRAIFNNSGSHSYDTYNRGNSETRRRYSTPSR